MLKRKRGLYRFDWPGIGECARTHAMAGDASPFLDRATYEALGFIPAFEALPTRAHYLETERTARRSERRFDAMWAGATESDARTHALSLKD